MKIKWFGYSSFSITTDSGVKIITDPYQPDPIAAALEPINEPADVVTMSHGHFAVSFICDISGEPRVYTGPEDFTMKDVRFKSIETFHGRYHGRNNIICFKADGLDICHLGDLGHVLSEKQVQMAGNVDVLLFPGDGNEITLTYDQMSKIIKQLKPAVRIPMRHFEEERFPESWGEKIKLESSEFEITANSLPSNPQVIILKPAKELIDK